MKSPFFYLRESRKILALKQLFSQNPEFLDFFVCRGHLLRSDVSNLAFCAPEAMGLEQRLFFQAAMDMAYAGGGLFFPTALQYWSRRSWADFLTAVAILKGIEAPAMVDPREGLLEELEELF